MKKIFIFLISIVCCACSIFNGHEQTLRIISTPKDATIYVNDTPHTSPLEINVPRNDDVRIRVVKDGYYPFETVSRTTLSGYGITDTVSGCFLLLPLIGLASPGAWELTRTDFDVLLVQIPPKWEGP